MMKKLSLTSGSMFSPIGTASQDMLSELLKSRKRKQRLTDAQRCITASSNLS
ncbi:hypothetical protein NDJ08_15715 [Vibrio alginolyticus]|uniref:hypothetical protein n=1 Tax=Vibrio alginolyticus TaxID=663 RepID=UPI001EEAE60A|nr:hypothetical protein [Vibrio alginolyticus]MCG6322868.1 hypothetical protein [Vibrio alginolyticus]MCR9520665.1 hypothetical protein [Vibrio alginolyticus]MCS0168041.1 hypothetical protein [Vibrio alginolyticus]